jgi:hypothetical protein
VSLQREIGDKWAIANALNNLGNVARAQGDYEAAHARYRESLALNRELDDRLALAYLLEDTGTLAALQGYDERALRLLAAAARVRQVIQAPLSSGDQRKLDTVLVTARQALDEARREAAWADGYALSLDAAVALALAPAAGEDGSAKI